MCAKRSLSVLADPEDQQENQPKVSTKPLCQKTSTDFAGSPKANLRNVLGDSLSTQQRNNVSKFEESWLNLNKSCLDQSLIDASEDICATSSPATKRRAKALPISFNQNSPRTPTAMFPSRLSSSFQTSSRWNTLLSGESSQSQNTSPQTSPLMPDKSPRMLSSSFKTSRLWNELLSEELCQKSSNDSPKTSPSIEKSNWRLSSSFRTSQRWNDLMSDHLLNDQSSADDSHVESSPSIRLVPDQPSQYLPSGSSSQKRAPKSQIRAVKGGYADRFQRLLKSVRMDQRHLSSREATHKGQVLAITEEFNVLIVLFEVENQQGNSSSSFNILLQSNQSKNLEVGSKLQFYLDPNIKPLELSNKQLVYCQPHNVTIL